MAWARKSHSTYGRFVPKPEAQNISEEISDEVRMIYRISTHNRPTFQLIDFCFLCTSQAIPIQDQIENLRAKISLKERYNKALQDDLAESNEGASTYISQLSEETKELRTKLVEALESEKAAVQNALRTHREFQLAMTNRPPSVAIPWLDDKLFDMAKLLNSLLDKLKHKRKKLEESEQEVIAIEKCPRPGTLPWEVDAISTFNRLECLIEGQKVKRETCFILHSKYIEIKYQLLAERGKYASILKNMECSLRTLKNELNSLETMLDDAVYFRNEAYKNLVLTEKEASENRKRRRIQMSKMKRAVERILEENQRVPTKKDKDKEKQNIRTSLLANAGPSLSEMAELLKLKRMEVEEYQGRARKLVETMRVPDLTYIPARLRTVSRIGQRLKIELEMKQNLRDLLIKQKDQLTLVLHYFRYTGVVQLEEFETFQKEYLKSIREAKSRQDEVVRKLDKVGQINVELRLGLLSILDHLSADRRKTKTSRDENMMQSMKLIIQLISKLLEEIKGLRGMFRRPADRNYSLFVKPLPLPNKFIRVGTPHQSEESEGDDDFVDSKVPGRTEIKAKSARLLNQAMLQRGMK